MSEIPDDVMKRARELVYGTFGAVDTGKEDYVIIDAYFHSHDLLNAIASALMEERERCAKIAEGNDHFPAEGEFIASLIRGTDAPSG